MSCPAANACTAVGSSAPNFTGVTEFTLAERWDGTRWSIQRTPNRPGTGQLNAVSCPTVSACTAVGSTRFGDQIFALAEQWNGTAWSLQPIPSPPGAVITSLSGVSCTAATACTAVGSFQGAHGPKQPLAERWDGTAWSIQPVPSPASQGGYLADVSCSAATACTAAGLLGSQTVTLAARWDGTAWSLQNSPATSGGTDTGSLSGVSCPAATACTAVGDFFNSANDDLTLAEHWDGTAWSVQPTPSPGSGGGDILSAVACPSTTSCVAVGTQSHGNGLLGERFGG